MSMLNKLGLGAVLAATTLSAAVPADAQYYRGYRHDGGGDVAAGAGLGGILGLGIGAAIAGNDNRRYDRGYGYNRGYYYDNQPRVVYRERYYTPPARVIIRERYYGSDGYNGYNAYNGYNGYNRGYSDRYDGRGYYGY